MQAGDDLTGWARTSARLRASLLSDQLAERDEEGSNAGTEQDAQQAAQARQESSSESASGAAQKDASAGRRDGKERELQEPEVVQNGFVTKLSGLSGQSSGQSSGSDSRSLTGQPSGHSSMHSIPEGKPMPCIDQLRATSDLSTAFIVCLPALLAHRPHLASTGAVTCRASNLRAPERQPLMIS